MNGRLENRIKIERRINNILSDMPECISGYYYSLLASGREITTCLDYLIKIRLFQLMGLLILQRIVIINHYINEN